MTKITLSPKILFRVPQFPMDATLVECWDALKESIAISSPTFYQLVASVSAEQFRDLPLKYQQTIQKYFNRARFRATPYGTFAGFGFHECAQDIHSSLIIDTQQTIHRYRDWIDKEIINKDILSLLSEDTKLFANSTWYKVQDLIRYVYLSDGNFQLTDIPHNELIEEILNACKKPIPYSELNRILQEKGLQVDWLMEFVHDLVGEQLLISSYHPNIIGTDYFQRIGFPTIGSESYILTERKVVGGNIDSRPFKHLPALALALSSMDENSSQSSTLRTFSQQYLKRYDQRAMPIMEALDPEIGIGYGNFEKAAGSNELIEGLIQLKQAKEESISSTDSLAQKIADKISLNSLNNSTLQLEDFLQDEKHKTKLPNSFSALVNVSDEHVQLEHFGSATANSLIGRFTMGNTSVTKACKEFAQIEAKANPEALFFDIAYMAEGKVDNINRREQLYDYQLSILNYDTTETPLHLQDILVFVDREEVVLYSKQYKKRLIPRLTTAYNYSRSDLPLFRLLCDIQAQHIAANLMIDLSALLPNFTQYPRMQYKNIVITPAKWKLESKVLAQENQEQSLQSHIVDRGITRYIKVGEADQTLCLDITDEADLSLLLQILIKRKTLMVEEYYFPKHPTVKDTDGRPYTSQYLLTYTHDKEIYPIKTPTAIDNKDTKRHYLPGSEWLYVELYCHVRQADRILQQYIKPMLAEEKDIIKEWFFIRYNDPSEHIRLRIKLLNPSYAAIMLNKLNTLLENEISAGLLQDLQVKTYVRELERYGSAYIEQIENHFFLDSQFALSLLQQPITDSHKYHLCLTFLQDVYDDLLIAPSDLSRMIRRIRDGFHQEQGIQSETFKSINKSFDNLQKELCPSMSEDQQILYQIMFQSIHCILTECTIDKQQELFASLFHMHVNRLFADNQRSHEMLIYNFIEKKLKKRTALDQAIRA